MEKVMDILKKVRDFFKKYFSVVKLVFFLLGLLFGFAAMLTEKGVEYNWVFAIVACIIQCGFFEAIHAVTSKEKRYDWRNPVLALAATIVAIFICLLL
nr:MAG TPA: putative periplasmic lipoprotein [Caudoviricetes sp.]